MLIKGSCCLILKMDCSAIDCTPEDVLEKMGLSRKGDIYALKALCSQNTGPRTV